MSRSTSTQDSSVESEDRDGVDPAVLAQSIQNKTNAVNAHGEEIAERLETLADAEDGDEVAVDTAAMMTELLETASDLIEVAHEVEAARVHGSE